MNENIDLTKILKNCPKGWEFYSSVLGEVEFVEICDDEKGENPIWVKVGKLAYTTGFTKEGFYLKGKGECTLFPSKDQRDWSKFTAPWYKKGKFDPNTFQSLDRVLTHFDDERWDINFYSYKNPSWPWPYTCMDKSYKYCIPYNDETKHLVGTTDEAPEYYKHWED